MMRKSEKIFVGLLLFVVLFFLLVKVIIPFSIWLNPDPVTILSRMERRDPEAAQEMIDYYSEDLKTIAAAAEILEDGEQCYYPLNFIAGSASADWYEENVLCKIPQELLDVLQSVEEKYPECRKSLELRKGQVGIGVTHDGSGFSILCYPGGNLIRRSVIEDERGTRCLDMGDGWELQMYYAPGG